MKGLSALADERCRTDKLDGVIKHTSSRETTMVGRGASLEGRLFLGGTDGSNPVPSSSESGELPYCRRRLVAISSNASPNCRPSISSSAHSSDLAGRLNPARFRGFRSLRFPASARFLVARLQPFGVPAQNRQLFRGGHRGVAGMLARWSARKARVFFSAARRQLVGELPIRARTARRSSCAACHPPRG